MPDYSIFALGESQMTISGGEQLDGISQGDGSHLVGQTITLNAPAWEEMRIRDDDDDFRDNDSGQRLIGEQSFDGVRYPDNAVVEAEYAITLSDGTNTWTAIGFNIVNSDTSYATVEGLAFIGGPGGFPPVGTPLSVVEAYDYPDFAQAAYATPACFAAGTRILTATGPRRVEQLVPGDKVVTAGGAVLELAWTGGRRVLAVGRFAPVEIAAGVLGAGRRLLVSQQHRLLLGGPLCELLFGTDEVLAPAAHLLGCAGLRLRPGGEITYHHLGFDRHAVVLAEGLAAESRWTGTLGAEFFGEDDSEETELLGDAGPAGDGWLAEDMGPLARRLLRRHETALLLAAAGEAGLDALTPSAGLTSAPAPAWAVAG